MPINRIINVILWINIRFDIMKDARKFERLLKVREAAEYLGVSIPVFYKLINAGDILQVSVGVKSKRYDLEDLNEFIMKNKNLVKK